MTGEEQPQKGNFRGEDNRDEHRDEWGNLPVLWMPCPWGLSVVIGNVTSDHNAFMVMLPVINKADFSHVSESWS